MSRKYNSSNAGGRDRVLTSSQEVVEAKDGVVVESGVTEVVGGPSVVAGEVGVIDAEVPVVVAVANGGSVDAGVVPVVVEDGVSVDPVVAPVAQVRSGVADVSDFDPVVVVDVDEVRGLVVETGSLVVNVEGAHRVVVEHSVAHDVDGVVPEVGVVPGTDVVPGTGVVPSVGVVDALSSSVVDAVVTGVVAEHATNLPNVSAS